MLGQDYRSEARVEALLHGACTRAGSWRIANGPKDLGHTQQVPEHIKKFAIQVHPMYSQDLFALYTEDLLFV